MDKHLEEYDLLEGEQRGAKPRCSGTTDNLLVDRMVCHDSRNSRKNVSMAWIDVRKAFDSVRVAAKDDVSTQISILVV